MFATLILTAALAPAPLPAALPAPAAPVAAAPDSWLPFRDQTFAAENGAYGVTVRRAKGGARFVYFARDGGQPRIEAAKLADGSPDAPAGARILAQGMLPQQPYELVVSGEGLGFAALERWGGLGYGKCVLTVNASGEFSGSWTLEDLFDESERMDLRRTVSSIWWYEGAWIQEKGAELVVVGAGKIFTVDLVAGRLEEAGDGTLERALVQGGDRGARLALERLAPRRIARLAPAYIALLAPEHALPLRLRAGLALAELGDLRARGLFEDTAFPSDDADPPGIDEQRFALRHGPTVVGAPMIPRLRELMRGEAGPCWGAALQAFERFGEDAVPTLLEMLAEGEESNDYRGGAAHALRTIGSRAALGGLLDAIGDEQGYVANAALNAAVAIDPAACSERLARWLTMGTTQDAGLVDHFQEHRHPDAVAALEAARARTDEEGLLERIDRALTFQRAES